MKKFSLSMVILLVFACIQNVDAEKVIASYVLTPGIDGYAVDERGGMIEYTNTNAPGGLLSQVSYSYTSKPDKDVVLGTLPLSDVEPLVPNDITDCEIVGLSRGNILVKFSNAAGTDTYFTYKISNNGAKIRTGTNVPYIPIDPTNTSLSLYKSRVVAFYYTGGNLRTIKTFNYKFVEHKSKKVTGQGTISGVNPDIYKYYKDVITDGVSTTVRIIKP